MDKKLLLAIALSFVILFAFSKINQKFNPPKPSQNVETKAQEEKKETPSVETTTINQLKKVENTKSAKEETTEISNDDLNIVFTSINGTIKSITLKKYNQTLKKDSERVDLIPTEINDYSLPQWEYTLDKTTLAGPVYYKLEKTSANSITLSAQLSPSVSIIKSFTLEANYKISFSQTIYNSSNSNVAVAAKTYLPYDLNREIGKKNSFFGARADFMFGAFYAGKKTIREQLNSLKETKKVDTQPNWAGLADRYFLISILPTVSLPTAVEISVHIPESNAAVSLFYPERTIKPNSSIEYKYNLYTGPQDINILKQIDETLPRAIDLGDWLGPIARPILVFLKFIYRFIPNYGLAIIILTLLVKIVLIPVTHKQNKSMKAMQNLQPQLKELKEKYKNDKQRLNVETMNMFKRNKVNPMGGCLPMLLQMPVFFALYKVLYSAVELRHAPFVFWLKDLSAPDPYYISPVLMGGAMFLQQIMTPTMGTDPAQAKMMRFMPLIFSLFMLALPSGLVIYFLVNALLSILQQWWTMRKDTTLPALIKNKGV